MKRLLPAGLLLALAVSAAACSGLTGEGADGVRYRRVSPQVAFLILRDTPDLLIVDLRTGEEFAGPEGHLARAVNMPLENLEERLAELSNYRDRTFLVYCRSDGECGPRGMSILVAHGYPDAILMEGGIGGWLERGYGTVGGRPADVPSGHKAPASADGGG